MPMEATQKEVLYSEVASSRHALTHASPMPKKKAPTDQSSNQGQWGKNQPDGIITARHLIPYND
jgi:hypothetical protein